jgi:hypothetical protein
MSRTSLCVLTAGVLAVLSLGIMLARYQVLGEEIRRPRGPGTWKVSLAVQGNSQGPARLLTATPLDLERQHLLEESYSSEQMTCKPPDNRHPGRRRVLWSLEAGRPNGPFRLQADFHLALHGRTSGNNHTGVHAPPRPGEYLSAEPLIETNDEAISAAARELTAELPGGNLLDTAQALFHFVELKIKNEVAFEVPSLGAVDCLNHGAGDRCARSRLLVALLRNRNIPARVVHGLTLARGSEQPHYWVEAFLYEHWTPMCPHYRLFGRVPSTYVLFGFGDRPLVSGKYVSDLKYVYSVERVGREEVSPDETVLRRVFQGISLYSLPAADRRLVEVLLLLPLAALLICIFRNVIGLHSFGTFAPALIGLAFHDLHSLPGILVFVSILLVGWLMRRLLDNYHLLQVPRVATMLTLIMSLLIVLVVLSNVYGAATTRYISLFPMVILTGMVERFWTLETEDSTAASFKTLLQTMFIATVIALVLSRPFVVEHLFCFPETLGLVMAAQLLIGRYTGYRLLELFRFRDFLQPVEAL